MIGVASLSLAACGGGGDSTVQIAPVKQTPTPPNGGTWNCNAVPRPAGCPDPEPTPPVVPVPFAPLGSLETSYAVAAVKKARFGIEQYPLYLYKDEETMQITALKHRPFTNEDDDRLKGWLTKAVTVTPTGDVDWKFELWRTGVLVTDGGSFERGGFKEIARSQAIAEDTTSSSSDKIFSLEKDDYMAKSVDFGFEEPYNVMEDYQILTAEVDTDDDKDNDATLYAELWTDYPGSTANDYIGGGFWLLVPKDVQDNASYDFGGFVRRPEEGSIPDKPLTGQMTYKGAAVGLHTSLENNTAKISRLLGKVTITIDFQGAQEWGKVDGRIHNLTLNGRNVGGELLLERDIVNKPNPVPNWGIGNINGINYTGQWDFVVDTYGDPRGVPRGVVGTIGGTGSNGNTVVATFGAKKGEAE